MGEKKQDLQSFSVNPLSWHSIDPKAKGSGNTSEGLSDQKVGFEVIQQHTKCMQTHSTG